MEQSSFYEEKKRARIERMLERAGRLEEFSKKNTLSLYGEASSGIPLGQPILVGHHSEKRHRRHLERIEKRVRKGFEAAEEAEKLRERAEAMENRMAIDSDNPEARTLLAEKIAKLEKKQAKFKRINQLVRQSNKCVDTLAELLSKEWPEEMDKSLYGPRGTAKELLTPDFAGRFGIAPYIFTNLSAEIRRLKKRQEELTRVTSGFEPYTVETPHGVISVELKFGQVQVEFPWKPSEATRSVLKRSPLALKWSSYSGRWVRKHTASTASEYFRQELIKALEVAVKE